MLCEKYDSASSSKPRICTNTALLAVYMQWLAAMNIDASTYTYAQLNCMGKHSTCTYRCMKPKY